MNGADPRDFLNLATVWNDFASANAIDECLDPDEFRNLRATFYAGAYATLMIIENIHDKHPTHLKARKILTHALVGEVNAILREVLDA